MLVLKVGLLYRKNVKYYFNGQILEQNSLHLALCSVTLYTHTHTYTDFAYDGLNYESPQSKPTYS